MLLMFYPLPAVVCPVALDLPLSLETEGPDIKRAKTYYTYVHSMPQGMKMPTNFPYPLPWKILVKQTRFDVMRLR
jgi:hypothetical protein